MRKAVFQTEILTCPTCAQKIESALAKQTGVDEVKVMFYASKVKITFDETRVTSDELADTITKLGYQVMAIKVS